MERKIKSHESLYQNYIDEVLRHNPSLDCTNKRNFFNYIEELPQDHIPELPNLKMVKQTVPGPEGLNFIYTNIQESLVYNFDRSIKRFEEIERLALSLQLRHLDPKLYELIHSLIDTKPAARNIIFNNPSKNPHAALAGDLDIITARLKSLISHLNTNYSLNLEIRDDLR